MKPDLIVMSQRELDRLEILTRPNDKRLTQRKASELLGLSERQTRRLMQATQRKGPLTSSTFRKLLAVAGERAESSSRSGFKPANDGQDSRAIQHHLGHRNIQHTVGYTQLAADRFSGFWED